MNGNNKIDVAVLGATGLIGQAFVNILAAHPFFRIAVLSGNRTGLGKKYGETVRWALPSRFPVEAGELIIGRPDTVYLKKMGIKYIFSALPSDIAGQLETDLRSEGFYVFSNAGAHREDVDVPILIPDVNPGTLKMILDQGYPEKGFILTNPNCTTSGLAVALNPLKKFGIEEIIVSTYQAVSGAGYPGLSAMDITGSVIPHIEGEERKVETEIKKILEMNPDIHASCVRVPTLYGHLETVWVRFSGTPEPDDILNEWEQSSPAYRTHSLTRRSVEYVSAPGGVRNDLSFRGDPPGMQVFTGGLKVKKNRVGFHLMVNNLVRGGAGGSVANAELFHLRYGRVQ